MSGPRLQVLLAAVCFGTTGTAQALGPAGLFEWVLERRRPQRRWLTATALACAGVALLALSGGEASVSGPGVALAVTAGGAYATYTLAAKRLLAAGHAPEAVMAVAFGLGALVLAPVLVATDPSWLLQADGVALAVFLGVVPTAVAYVLFARGLRRLTASETATLTLAEPLTAGLLGAVVLAERLSAASVLGAGLVLAGMLALTLRLPTVASAERAPA